MKPLFEINREISVPNLIAALLGVAYVSGYLIRSIYVKSIGIPNDSFVKSEYIETGIIFIVLALVIIIIPFGIYTVLKRIQTEHKEKTKKYSRQRMIPTFIITMNFLFTAIFFAIFLTNDDLNITVSALWQDLSLLDFFNVYVFSVLVILVFLSLTRIIYVRFISQNIGREDIRDKLYELSVNAIKLVLITFSVYFDVILINSISWFGYVLYKSRYFILFVLIFSILITFVPFRFNTLDNEKNRTLLATMSSVIASIIFYLTIVSYSLGLYPVLPFSKGGAYPVALTILNIKKDIAKNLPEIVAKSDSTKNETIPLFVVEESSNFLYLTKPYAVENIPDSPIYSLKISDIISATTIHKRVNEIDIKQMVNMRLKQKEVK